LETAAGSEAVLKFGLELIKRGVLLLNCDAEPLVMNQAAADILAKGDGLSLSANRLESTSTAETRILIALLREVILSPEAGEPKRSPFPVRRRRSRSPLLVRVGPGPKFPQEKTANGRVALVTLCDPDREVLVDENALCRLYGLTRGEAALAGHLMRGKSIADAAGELFLSVHTVRTHLKRIFMKTDTHRQPELVVQMLAAVL
jgi:DNA-binding CsgD family transcriptional regulator